MYLLERTGAEGLREVLMSLISVWSVRWGGETKPTSEVLYPT